MFDDPADSAEKSPKKNRCECGCASKKTIKNVPHKNIAVKIGLIQVVVWSSVVFKTYCNRTQSVTKSYRKQSKNGVERGWTHGNIQNQVKSYHKNISWKRGSAFRNERLKTEENKTESGRNWYDTKTSNLQGLVQIWFVCWLQNRNQPKNSGAGYCYIVFLLLNIFGW